VAAAAQDGAQDRPHLPLRAPVEGTVQSVRCGPGDLVQPGTPLVEVA